MGIVRLRAKIRRPEWIDKEDLQESVEYPNDTLSPDVENFSAIY